MMPYYPEGVNATAPTLEDLRRSAGTGDIFQARCIKCDEYHNLHLDLGSAKGIIPRAETALGIAEGKLREIGILSRVGKPVCFQVMDIDRNGTVICSRRLAQLDARRYFFSALQPGDIILIPEGIMHNTEYQNTTYSRKLISCSEYFIPQSVKPKLSELMHLYRNPNITDEINAIFNKIEAENDNRDELSEDIFKCYTNMLFFLLARNPNLCIPQEDEKHYIDDAIEFLQSNYSLDVTLEKMAARYFVSAEHFSRVFKKKIGFNFKEYINLLRLQKAESMLRQMNAASITEVAQSCGFNDSNYFSVQFKKLYGISPKRFQSSNRSSV
jgi:AraC-like DNA-binding protein